MASPTPPPFAELGEQYFLTLAGAGRSIRTIEAYEYGLRSLARFVASDDPEDVTPLAIARWLQDRRERISASNANFVWRSSKPFFTWLAAQGELDGSNPFAKVPAPKVQPKVIPVLTDDEIHAVLDACSGRTWRERRDRAIVRTLLDTGIRRSEALSLSVADVDLVQGVIHVRVSKSRQRLVPLGNKSRAELRAWLRARRLHLHRIGHTESNVLFIGREGQPLTGSGLYAVVRRLLKAAGVTTERACHIWRNSWAVRGLENGAQELDLAHLAGWAPRSASVMLSRYTESGRTERAIHNHQATWSPGDRL